MNTNLSFGKALDMCINNNVRIAREGWNGKGMYVFLGENIAFDTKADLSGMQDKEFDGPRALILKTAQDTFQVGWLASQGDMLANDWVVLDEITDSE